jgi:hypothetical protein
MRTVADTIDIMKISQYLASADVAKGSLFTPQLDERLPLMLYTERRFLEKIYLTDSTYEGLQDVANYGYALCAPYVSKAQNILNTGSGGSSGGVTPSQAFPIYITSSDFTSATFYPNTALYGKRLVVFVNELNQYLFEGTGFSLSATGMTILVDGFDATSFDYNIIIEKVS